MGVSHHDTAAKPQESVVPVLIIIGPVGIGKSSTADAVSEMFEYEYGFAHAVVDLDDVRRSYPAPKDDGFNMEMGFRNLAAVWANYKTAGARCLIIPSVMESEEDLARVKAAVPGAKLFVVRLTASLEVNHERIRGREKTESALNWHLNRSAVLARELADKRLENLIVDTEGKVLSDVAREIIAKWHIVEWFGANRS